jgi:hypothetical protein
MHIPATNARRGRKMLTNCLEALTGPSIGTETRFFRNSAGRWALKMQSTLWIGRYHVY